MIMECSEGDSFFFFFFFAESEVIVKRIAPKGLVVLFLFLFLFFAK